MGVSRVKTSRGVKYRARVSENGKRKSLGTFKRRWQAEEALKSYRSRSGVDYENHPTPAEVQQEQELAAGLEEVQGNIYDVDCYPEITIGEPRPTFWQRVKGWFGK